MSIPDQCQLLTKRLGAPVEYQLSPHSEPFYSIRVNGTEILTAKKRETQMCLRAIERLAACIKIEPNHG